jgi:phage terminase large subunit-like protein
VAVDAEHHRAIGEVRLERGLVEVAKEWDVHGVHVERAAGGDAMVADLASVVAGIQGHPPTGSKAVRAAPYLPLMAARQLRLPAAVQPWMRGYREAMVSVTGMGDEDDHYLDATVWALVGAQADRRPTHRQWAQALGSG